MKLLLLLLVLALRRLEWPWPDGLCANQRFAQQLMPFWRRLGRADALWHWWLAVVLPTLALLFIFCVLQQGGLLGLLLWWLLGVLLLLWLLGAEGDSRRLDVLLAHARLGNWDKVAGLASANFAVTLEKQGVSGLEEGLLLRDLKTTLVTIFYLLLLGYWAVFLYFINEVYLKLYAEKAAKSAFWLQKLMLYPVARLQLLSLALVSDFQAVMAAARGAWVTTESQRLLCLLLPALLPSGDSAGQDNRVVEVERLVELHAVLMRSLALWLVLAAIWVMF